MVIFRIVKNAGAAEQLAERNEFFGDQFRSDLCKAKTRLRLQNEVCCLAESRIVKRKTVLVKKGRDTGTVIVKNSENGFLS